MLHELKMHISFTNLLKEIVSHSAMTCDTLNFAYFPV